MNKTLVPLLAAKTAVTLLGWALPMLFFPPALFRLLGFPVPDPMIFVRLLGCAYLALVVVYWSAIGDLRQGLFPAAKIWTGIVSNGGAAILLAIYGFGGQWQNWGNAARALMWASCGTVTIIAACLLYFSLTEKKGG